MGIDFEWQIKKSSQLMRSDIIIYPYFTPILDFKYQRKSEKKFKMYENIILLNVDYFTLKHINIPFHL